MNILLVGGKSHFLQLLIEKLNKEGHRIFILTDEPKSGRPTRKVFETYHFSYEESCIREVVESIQPDETIFLGAFDTNYKWAELKSHAGAFSAGLMNVLSAFVGCSTGRFIYLSSEEVFQQEFADAISEDETPGSRDGKRTGAGSGRGHLQILSGHGQRCCYSASGSYVWNAGIRTGSKKYDWSYVCGSIGNKRDSCWKMAESRTFA